MQLRDGQICQVATREDFREASPKGPEGLGELQVRVVKGLPGRRQDTETLETMVGEVGRMS
jgi:hypothetical protein